MSGCCGPKEFKPKKVKITIDGKEFKYLRCGIEYRQDSITFKIITKEDDLTPYS